MNFVINVESLRSEFFFILKIKKGRIYRDVIYNKLLITKKEIIVACRVDRVWFIFSTFSIRFLLLF